MAWSRFRPLRIAPFFVTASLLLPEAPAGTTEVPLLPALPLPGQDFYGYGVAISGDTVVVGSRGDDDLGSAVPLVASDAATGSSLGYSVSTDAGVVVVGANPHDGASVQSGATYLCPDVTGGPWTDLGFALDGVVGDPALAGTGTLAAGGPGSLDLSNAAPSAPCLLFASLSSTPVPFKGGTLVALPSVLDLLLATDGAGTTALPFVWPIGIPADTEKYLQDAIADAAAPVGVALSNALLGVAQ